MKAAVRLSFTVFSLALSAILFPVLAFAGDYSPFVMFSSATRLHPIFFHDFSITLGLKKTKSKWNCQPVSRSKPPKLRRQLPITTKSELITSLLSLAQTRKKLIYNRPFHFGKGGKVIFPVGAYQPLTGLFDNFHKVDTQSLVLKQDAAVSATTN